MKTRDKILQTALLMYNSNGYTTITTRHIAEEIKISPGNLHYHFKHTEDIVLELFKHLLDKAESLLSHFKTNEILGLENLNIYFKNLYSLFYDYQFFFLNFVAIAQEIPKIQLDYILLYERRKVEFLEIFSRFKALGLIENTVKKEMIDDVITQAFLVGDNFLSHNQIITKLDKENSINYYSQLTVNLFKFITKI